MINRKESRTVTFMLGGYDITLRQILKGGCIMVNTNGMTKEMIESPNYDIENKGEEKDWGLRRING